MGVFEVEGLAISDRDEDGDALDIPDWGNPHRYWNMLGITDLVEKASGVPSAHRHVLWEMEHGPDQCLRHEDQDYDPVTLKGYRRTSGRQWPPIYRLKIQVEAEALPDEEVGPLWEKYLGLRVSKGGQPS